MAKVVEEVVIIRFSKLVKANSDSENTEIANSEILSALEQVAQELVGSGVIVEAVKE